ncbi:MAG: sigma-70 family RNA polymerase sigma factor [Planctomycetota bacterium]
MPLDPDLLCEIWDECSERLGVIARAMGDGGEDAMQEAFVDLAKQATPPRNPLAWLVSVTRNRMTDGRRAEQRRKGREQRYIESREFDVWGLRPVGEELVNQEETHALAKALRSLPVSQREILVMHVWGEMTFAQIADATQKSTSRCHRDYQAALKLIARNMQSGTGIAQPQKMNSPRGMMI